MENGEWRMVEGFKLPGQWSVAEEWRVSEL